MSRKEIPGRAALSFPAVDGLLDMDQILETDPWNQINDFVQQNFMQNILEEFSDRIKLNPKLTPEKGDEATGKNRATSSSKKPRKNQTRRTEKEKSTEQRGDDLSADGGQGSKKTRKKRGTKGANKQEQIVDEKAKSQGKPKRESKRKSTKTSNTSKYQQESENGLETDAKVNSTAKRVGGKKKTGNIVEETQTAGTETGNATINNETMISTSQSINPPINTSTPKSKHARVNDFAEKEPENNVSDLKKSLLSNETSSKKCHVKEIRAKKDLNDNWDEVTIKEKTNEKPSIKCKREIEKNTQAKKTERIDKSTRSKDIKKPVKCNDDGKTATSKKIGKYEQRLLEKRKRREERKIRRHERKAERAMEEFGRHVTKIAQKMGYLPENGASSSSDYDFSDESSCDCCSYSSCSCCTCSSCSCSYEHSEYTPCSSSE